eukprot:TRINITY_DN13411_c0_g1_i1.p1 TRINITY_DN13411_c0_g1~~TRINITY_DN13411_c0_g1_i1.p1  ORF type:complete len:625 (+),score=139.80 TRINITY_DN13411_c0_g1_i1:34-1908(+)
MSREEKDRRRRGNDDRRHHDDRGFNRYRGRHRDGDRELEREKEREKEKERDTERDREDRDRRRRRRRSHSNSEERKRGDRKQFDKPSSVLNDDKKGGFKPAPWMSSSGPRPGENVEAAPINEQVRPEILLCKMKWDDPVAMDKRVGGLVPLTTDRSLNQRFAERHEEVKEEASVKQQLTHLSQLQQLGVPVGLLFPTLPSLCQEHSVTLNEYIEEEEDNYTPPEKEGGNKGGKGRRSKEDRELEAKLENHWPELPTWMWNKQCSQTYVGNQPCQVLLLSFVPADQNIDESLRAHFCKYGTVEQVISRVNYREAPRFVKNGLALIEMGSVTHAISAYSSPDPVCGNRFIKIFYAPDDVRKKVEKIRIDKMMQDRRERQERMKEREVKVQEAQQRLVAAKKKMTQLEEQNKQLRGRMESVEGDERKMIEHGLKEVAAALKGAMGEVLEAMEMVKSLSDAEKAKPAWQQRWQPNHLSNFSIDTRTCVFRLPNLPAMWLKSPAKLRRAMERYGEVLGCSIGGTQGYVRFKRRYEAERAVRALEESKHKPVWLEKETWEEEWPQDNEIVEEDEPVKPEVVPVVASINPDDDEALVEAELGLRNEEMIPIAKGDEEGGEVVDETSATMQE